MPYWFVLVLTAMASARLTRLVTVDVIVRGPREWLIARAYKHRNDLAMADVVEPGDWDELAAHDRNAPKLAALITCPWCVGVWLSAAVVGATWLFVPLPLPALWFASTALAAGWVGAATAD